MNDLKLKFIAWLDSLNPRERRLVIGGGIFLGVFILYQVTWAPFSSGVEKMQSKVNKQQQDLIWMQQASEEVRGLKGGSGNTQRSHSGSLLGLIEKTARQKGLGSAIRKVQPEGQNGVRVWMDKAAFDTVMSWLDELQVKQGISITNFTAERTATEGRVNVRLLAQGL